VALAAAVLGGGAGAAVASAMQNDSATAPAPAPVFTQGSGTPVDGRPSSVTSIAKKVLPSVVTVNVSGGGETGNGSGVIMTSDGYILTNNHVAAVGADGSIRVDFYNGKEGVPASIVGRDPKSDLAVLKVSGLSNLPAATLGLSSSLEVGDPVIAIGAPLDLSSTVTTGIVSALNRDVTVPGDTGERNVIIGAIQTDAAINPGNSGGALVDGLGQVVGINTAIATADGGNGSIGLGFAIPIDYAKSIADEIIRTGHATHPYVGVTASTVTADEAQANGTSQGAQVQTLVAGGPAADAGIRRGDVITRVDDKTIRSVDDLIAATRLHKVGDVVQVTYERGGQPHAVAVTLQEAPSG
jgi:putative serine protease PepD